MAAFMAMEINPPVPFFAGECDAPLVGVHPDIAGVGSAAAAIFSEYCGDVRIMAYSLIDIWIKALVLMSCRVFPGTTWSSAPSAGVADGFLSFLGILGVIHHADGPAAGVVAAGVVLIVDI